MSALVERLAGPLLDLNLAAAVLLGLGALVMVGARQPARRRLIARASLLASLAVGPLAAMVPVPRVELTEAIRVIAPPPPPPPAEPTPPSGPERQRPCPPSPAAVSRGARLFIPALLLFDITGIALGFAALALGLAGTAMLVRSSRLPSEHLAGLYREVAGAYGGSPPQLRTSDALRSPVLVGLFRPRILVPAVFDEPDKSGPLKLALLHELAHGEARDQWANLLGNIAQAIWFWIPFAWWIRAQMRLDQEFLADRRAAVLAGTSHNYARSLVDLADGRSAIRDLGDSPLGGTALRPRILMLVRCPFLLESRVPKGLRWAVPVVVAIAALAASSLSLRSDTSPPAKLTPVGGTFKLDRLRIEPGGTASNSLRGATLPPTLPADFDLTLECFLSGEELPQYRFAGCQLLDPGRLTADWHKIQVTRKAGRLAARLDDRPVAARLVDPGRRLTIRPPEGRPGLIRNLVLTW